MRIHSVTSSIRSNSLPTKKKSSPRDRNQALGWHTGSYSGPSTPEPRTGSRTTSARIEDDEGKELQDSRTSTTMLPSSSSTFDGVYTISNQESDARLSPEEVHTIHDLEMSRSTSVSHHAMIPVALRGRQFGESQATRKVTRLVQKDGHSNVTITKASRKNRRFIRDFFTTIMDMRLRYHIFLFISGFIFSWLLFAFGWLGIAYSNGDIPRRNSDNTTNSCLINVYDFSTALLFSIEMQMTIGFGFRLIGQHCPVATVLMMSQSVVGIFIQSFITGIIFAKIARPRRRAKTIVFSRNAVICVRDGFYNLVFRVGDLRKTHIIGTSIRALLIRSRETNEGELIPLCQYPLDLITESSITDSFVFFFWPVTVAHRITRTSPLWNLSAESILADQFEVIVILEGTAQTSGALIQIKTSYIPNEIKWGQRLTPLVTTQRVHGNYEIDFSNFHDTTPIHMPDFSAREYASRRSSNHLEPRGSHFRSSFTSPAAFGRVEDQNSFHLTLRNGRLHSRPPRPGRTTKTSKEVKHKGRMTAHTKRMEQEVRHAEAESRLPEVEVHVTVPPPTYESLGGNDEV